MLYFFIYGAFVLLILTWQDIKKKLVDARWNYFAHGISFSLTSHYQYHTLPVLILIFGFAFLKKYISKWIGIGDLTAIHWILYGTFIINPYLTGIFAVIFTIITALYGGLKLLFFGKNAMETPFYPVILSSFMITGYLYFLFFM